MSTKFRLLQPEVPIDTALGLFHEASGLVGERVFGLMVSDGEGHLVGILSMYDILALLQPKHIHIWGEMNDIDISGLIETICRKSGELVVGDIMSTEIITVSGDTHILRVLELMTKHHIQRIPVIESDRVVGIVYLSDLFFHLVETIKLQSAYRSL